MTKEIIVLQREVSPIITRAQQLVVKDAKTMTGAVDLLSAMNKQLDRIVEEREKVTVPLNEALKAERGRWKPMVSLLEVAIADVRAKMGSYQTQEVKRAKEEEARIAARVGDGKGKLQLETAVRKMEAIDTPAGVVSAGNGSVQFRTKQCIEVLDIKALPVEYLLVDEVEILQVYKEGKELPGIRYYTEQVPVNYR